MIDIHCHLIHDVDDGPSSIEESLKMVRQAERLGIKAIIATPHLHENFFATEKMHENFMQLKYRSSDYDVNLKMGYEVFINPLLSGKKGLTLGSSRYMLLELPFDSIPIYCFETIYNMQIRKIIPVIAHPERNRNFIKDFDLFLEFVERGCLMQLDAASVIGVYGKHAKDFTKKLVKFNLAHFVSSDAHFSNDYVNWYLKAYKTISNWVGEEQAKILFNDNAKVILEDSYDSVSDVV